jgi:hypothetical protein
MMMAGILTAIFQSTPSPLWGGIKGGGCLALISGLSHPLPSSPIKGEVPLHSRGTIQSRPPHGPSPIKGEARWGWGNTHHTIDINSRETSHG